jgi:hypothetical protein
MKRLFLTLTAFAFASTTALAGVIDDQRQLDKLTEACREASSETDQACVAVQKLTSDLKARGYCVYGHGVIGRAARGHCYEIKVISSGDYLKEGDR